MSKRILGVLALILLLLLSTQAQAAIIIDTTPGATDQLYPGIPGPYTVAETFVASGSNLLSFGFRLEDRDADSFMVQALVWGTSGGIPTGAPLFTSSSISVGSLALYSFSTGGLSITPGETYAVGFAWLPGSQYGLGQDIVMGRVDGSLLGTAYSSLSLNGTSPWFSLPQDIGIQVETVPEPGTLLLLGSGLVGLVGFGRKRFKK